MNAQSKIQNPKSKIPIAIQESLAHYHRRLAIRTGCVAALGLGCVAALLWRLDLLGLTRPWVIAIGIGSAAGLVVWQWRGLRRTGLTQPHVALKLDQALGLEGRLITTLEFANDPHPPALYPALVQDTVRTMPDSFTHGSRIADRLAVALAAAILLFLAWPWQRPALQRLAKGVMPASPPVEPPHPPPPPSTQPPQASQELRQDSQDDQQQPHGAGDSQQSGAEGQSEPSPSEQTGTGRDPGTQGASLSQQPSGSNGHASPSTTKQAPRSSGQTDQARTDRQASAQDSSQETRPSTEPSQASQADRQTSSQPPNRSEARQQASSSDSDSGRPNTAEQDQQRQAPSQQAATSQSPSQQASGTQPHPQGSTGHAAASSTPPQSRQGGARGRDSSSTSKQASSERQGSPAQEPGQQRAQTAQGPGTAQSSSAQQEQLKAQIEQLLKEMSGELKQLQSRLEADKPDQAGQPGTSTDPTLYDQPSALEASRGGPLPIQLDTDQQSISTTRRGGGVGEPSNQVVSATPQQQPEDAALADHADEEQAVSRQPIPPEYRPVFERLSHPNEQP